jgi:hypothetical protein
MQGIYMYVCPCNPKQLTYRHLIKTNKTKQLAELDVHPDYRFYAEAIEALWRMRPLVTLVRSVVFLFFIFILFYNCSHFDPMSNHFNR